MIGTALALLCALQAAPAAGSQPSAATTEPKIVLAMMMDGSVLRGGRRADERRLRAELGAMSKGDQVLLCLQGMNDKVSQTFDRVILKSPGPYDVKFLTEGRCPRDPMTQGAGSSR